MANIRTFFANAYETTLTAEMGATDLTFTVLSSARAPSTPAYIALEPDEAGQFEYVLVDSLSAETFTINAIGDRYLSGSAASSGLTHPIGAVVKMVPAAQMFEDLHDRVDSRLSSSAHTKALHDGLGLAHGSLAGLTSGDPHTQYLDVARHDTTSRHGSSVVDHGTIGGLGDNDHTQYLLKTGGTMTGNLVAPGVQLNATALATTGTVNLDLNGTDFFTQDYLTGDVTYTTSNRATGRSATVRVLSDWELTRTLSFPQGWRFIGPKPTSIAPGGKVGLLSITAFGPNDTDIVAAWAVEE